MASLTPILALLASFVILCTGHGLQSVLLPARAALENYSELLIAGLMSAYYVGFIIGTFIGPRLLLRVGHINVFAASTAGACATLLCFPLFPHPVIWIILRVLYGLCLVHLYTVMESWLNSISEPKTRGKLLSIYMLLNVIAMSMGQLFFVSTKVGGYEMFSIASILLALSLVPLLLSRTAKPTYSQSPEHFSIKKLYLVSPLGVNGVLVSGIICGGYWGLSAPYILKMGFSQAHIAWFMAASLIGGLIAQWPLGTLSDRFNRRWIILLATLMITLASIGLAAMAGSPSPQVYYGTAWLLACAVILGAGFHPLYSLCIAHANDFVPPEHFVKASTGLLLIQSLGALAGPLLIGGMMQYYGNIMLYGIIAGCSCLFSLYTALRLFENRIPKYELPYRMLTRTGMIAFMLDPRHIKRVKLKKSAPATTPSP